MVTTSDDMKALLRCGRTFDDISIIFDDGSLELSKDSLIENGFQIDYSSQSTGLMELGSVIASQLSLSLSADSTISAYSFTNASVHIKYYLRKYYDTYEKTSDTEWDTNKTYYVENDDHTEYVVSTDEEFKSGTDYYEKIENGGYNILQMEGGYFTVTDVQKTSSVIYLTCLDSMIKFDKSIADDVTLGNETLKEMLKKIIQNCLGYEPADTAFEGLKNLDKTCTTTFDSTSGVTYRQVLSYVLAVAGACGYFDENDEFKMSWYADTGESLELGYMYSLDYAEDEITVEDETSAYLEYSPRISVTDADSPVDPFSFRTFNTETMPLMWYRPLDIVTVNTLEGTTFKGYITNVSYSLGSTMTITCECDSSNAGEYSEVSGFTDSQQDVIDEMPETVVEYINVNKLTADCIQAGQLKSNNQDETLGDSFVIDLDDAKITATGHTSVDADGLREYDVPFITLDEGGITFKYLPKGKEQGDTDSETAGRIFKSNSESLVCSVKDTLSLLANSTIALQSPTGSAFGGQSLAVDTNVISTDGLPCIKLLISKSSLSLQVSDGQREEDTASKIYHALINTDLSKMKWKNLTLVTDVATSANAGGSSVPMYRAVGDTVELKGAITCSDGGTHFVIANLDDGYKPSSACRYMVATSSSDTYASLRIGSDGTVDFFGFYDKDGRKGTSETPSSNTIHLCGIRIPIPIE